MAKTVVVTGGNAGIGLALCKQLVLEHGCKVFLGARNQERGEAAAKSILADAPPEAQDKLVLVIVDVASDESVTAAAADVKEKLGGTPLYAVVNNAGCGLAHGVDADTVLNTNFNGPKRMCEAFIPLLDPINGRIVNVGSGAGPMFVGRVEANEDKKVLCTPPETFDVIEATIKKFFGSDADNRKGYGVSKAALTMYTALLATQNPNLKISVCSPGFIDTAIVKGFGATKPPEEGTVAIRHLLFAELEGSGWYYGSDGVRSPLHFMRNPGEPPYDGVVPF